MTLSYTELLAKYGTHRHGHSIFAPSGSAGWLNCPGYLLANAVAEDDAGVDAAYGTIAHSVAERWQKNGEKPVKLIGRTEYAKAGGNSFPILIDEAMMEYVEEYVNWCNEVPGEHHYEQRVDLSPYLPIPDQGGTADHFAMWFNEDTQRWWLTITDLKMGKGVRVYAEHNTQAQLYALGVFIAWDWIYNFENVVIRICQPRLNVFEVWERSRDELLAFGEFVREKAVLGYAEGAPRVPGQKQCRFCAARKTCAARAKHADDILDAIFEDVTEPAERQGYMMDTAEASLATEQNIAAVGTREYYATSVKAEDLQALPGMNSVWGNREQFKALSTHALSYILTHRRHIEQMFSDFADELMRRAENGEKLPYQKITDGRKRRFFVDARKAVIVIDKEFKFTPDQMSPRKLLSPSKMSELIRAETGMKPGEIRKWLEDNAGVDAHSGKRTLVDLRDDRPDVFDETSAMFEAEMEEDDL